MKFLNINAKSLEVQRKVVIEEFKERYLNKPFGMAWHELRALAYQTHSYQWPTIGRSIKEIEDASLPEVQAFYEKFYHPNNAILTLCGNISMGDRPLIEKWFADLSPGETYHRHLPQEQKQVEPRRKEIEDDVPVDAIYIAFHMPARGQKGYYASDLLSDLLSNGKSSRLHQQLVKENHIFSEIHAYITGSFEPGLFIITGQPVEGISREVAEEAIWNQLHGLIENPPSEHEIQKVKNKVEANLVYQLMEPLYQALNLAFFELLGNAEDINKEHLRYQEVTFDEIIDQAKQMFCAENSNTLWYISKPNNS